MKTLNNFAVGDVVQVSLDPTMGSEIKKSRPCLIVVSESPLDIVTVLPITNDNGKSVSPFFAPISASKEYGLVKNSLIDCLQIRSVALDRVVKVLGRVDDNTMIDVKQRLVKMLDIGEEHL